MQAEATPGPSVAEHPIGSKEDNREARAPWRDASPEVERLAGVSPRRRIKPALVGTIPHEVR